MNNRFHCEYLITQFHINRRLRNNRFIPFGNEKDNIKTIIPQKDLMDLEVTKVCLILRNKESPF